MLVASVQASFHGACVPPAMEKLVPHLTSDSDEQVQMEFMHTIPPGLFEVHGDQLLGHTMKHHLRT